MRIPTGSILPPGDQLKARSVRSLLDLNDPDNNNCGCKFADNPVQRSEGQLQLRQDWGGCRIGTFMLMQVYGISFGCPYIITLVMKVMGSDLSVVHVIGMLIFSLFVFMGIVWSPFCPLHSSASLTIRLYRSACLPSGIVFRLFFLLGEFSGNFFCSEVWIADLGKRKKWLLGCSFLGFSFCSFWCTSFTSLNYFDNTSALLLYHLEILRFLLIFN